MRTPRATIVTIGDELLAGDTVDTNTAFLARRCRELGVEVIRAVSVRDRLDEITMALEEVAPVAPICLVSGGLGPTTDDLTAAAVAKAAQRDLERDPEVVRSLEAWFTSRGRSMPAANLKQADLPAGATRLDNAVGTAPGFAVSIRDKTGQGTLAFCMPGVPRELERMMFEQVEPRLREHVGGQPVPRRIYRFIGIGESVLAERIESVMAAARARSSGLAAVLVHYRARMPEVDVILESVLAADGTRASEMELASLDDAVLAATGRYLYGIGDVDLATRVVGALTRAGLCLGAAESCTGGMFGASMTSVPGASACFRGAIVAYDDAVKRNLLEVPSTTLEVHGAVSEDVARAMARGARAKLACDLAVAITGIAGPGGETPEKPVGTVHIALDDGVALRHERLRLFGSRAVIRHAAALSATKLVWDRLREHELVDVL